MSALDDWQPRGIDLRTPNVARMYDYYLGGKDHYAADREAAEQALACLPRGRERAIENRRFLGRVVRYLTTEAGIRQFIDIGTGLPTRSNVHEVAQDTDPETRVVYVDNDPVVLAHARALLANGNPKVGVVDGDMRHPDAILANPTLTGLIDFEQPIAVLFAAVLHFLTEDDDPGAVVTRFREAMSSGSYLVVSHVDASPAVKAAERVYEQTTSRAQGRTPAQVARFFTGFDLVDPGLVYVQNWRPDGGEHPGDLLLGGVGRKTRDPSTSGHVSGGDRRR